MSTAHADPLVGHILDGRYTLTARVGEGGMGVVYKAREQPLGRVVAIKVLNAHMARDPNWVQRFYNEAKATSQLQHPNTIRMLEFGQTQDGVLFLAMEFLDGQSLRDAIQLSAPMPPDRVIRIISQCCASLSEAHGLAIIHRDMKPDNVFLLGSQDHVKVLDFSVAKLLQDRGFKTAAGMVFGTPEYMSPEQGRGRELDARSDIYALGCIAYEMLTGKVPFASTNPMAILHAHMTQPPPALPATIPQPVIVFVMRCLDKEPGRRYASAAETKAECERVLAQIGASTGRAATNPNAPPSYPTPNPARTGGHGPPAAAAAQNPRADAQKTMMAGSAAALGVPQVQNPAAAAPSGAASANKTMFAGQGAAVGGPPPAAAAAQKTMFAQQSPLAGRPPPAAGGPPPPAGGPPPAVGGPPPAVGGPPPAAGGPPGAAKTMIAGNVGELLAQAGSPPGMGAGPPAMPAGPPAGPANMPPTGAPMALEKRTVMLQASDGVVSYAQVPTPPQVSEGASALFWIVCLVVGAGVGAGAYFLYVAMGAS